MILDSYSCDECGVTNSGKPAFTLYGSDISSAKAGIMFPRSDFHFCCLDCLKEWLKTVKTNAR